MSSMVRIYLQIAMFGGLLVVGLVWGRRTLRRWDEYSFSEDFRASFLRVHFMGSTHLQEGGPRLIPPVICVIMGIALLISIPVRYMNESRAQAQATTTLRGPR